MRRVGRVLVWLLGVMVFLAAFGYWQGQRLLERLAIHDLHWELRDLGLRHLHLHQLQFTTMQADHHLAVAATDLRVEWQWQGMTPRILHIDAATANLTLNPAEILPPPADDPVSGDSKLPESWDLPEVLPARVNIEQLVLNLPCAAGRCELAAQVRSLRMEQVLTLHVHLPNLPAPVALDLTYEVQNNLPWLKFNLAAPEFIQLNGDTRLTTASHWGGQLQLNARPPAEEWISYLHNWYAVDDAQLRAFDRPLHLAGDWDLALPALLAESVASGDITDLAGAVQRVREHLDGNLRFSFDAPASIPIPGVGGLSGKGRVELAGEAGVITHYSLDADARIEPVFLPESLAEYDLAIDSLTLNMRAQASEDFNLQALPVQISMEAQGRLQFTANVNLQLDSNTLAFAVSSGTLQANASQWTPAAEVVLNNLALTQRFTAKWQSGELTYTLLEPGTVTADITHPLATLSGAQLHLDQLVVSGDPAQWQELDVHVNAALAVNTLTHEDLLPQRWRWQGEMQGSGGKARLQGQLVASDSLTVNHQLALTAEQWQLDWKLPDIFLLAGNSLQQLTPLWPSLLTLARGRIGAEGRLRAAWDGPLLGDMTWRLADVSGAYDTIVFNGATDAVKVRLLADSLQVTSDNLSINEIVYGFTLGPARARIDYTAPITDLTMGRVQIQQLEAGLLGGRISLQPTTFDFAQDRQQVVIELREIDLARLLAEHPSSDLTGTGRLSGTIPIGFATEGISVAGGALAALEPGGRLQYRSDRTSAIAGSSHGMKIVTDALDDFHYTVLNSDVSYDASGTLLLGVRLEGRNPAVERGRPIHLNVTLEEDLPAMIYSLQLTNQINDLIKKRVQDKMRRRPAS